VEVPLAATVPDSITARVDVEGVSRAQGSWLGSEWVRGKWRRIALAFDAIEDSTGVYDYTLEVRSWYGTTSHPTVKAGELAIVNRASSPFGAGWWLAGLERLDVSTMVWIGGDGSVRKYAAVNGLPNVWVAPSVNHPDTLKKDTNGNYTRYDKDSVRVRFDVTGQHVATLNRQGHTTIFGYLNGRLSYITLPPYTASKSYQFGYDANGKLDSIAAPVVWPTSRVTRVTVFEGRLTSLRDPDNTTIQFGYHPTFANGISSRTDRNGAVTTFGMDAGMRVSQSSLNMGTGKPAIVIGLTGLESRGLSLGGIPRSVDTTFAYAKVDGPRTDVQDTTIYWLDRFGAPRKIVDALGHATLIRRADSNWPGLVTRIEYPRSNPTSTPQVLGMVYDNRGNLRFLTDSSTSSGAKYATTAYEWHPQWDDVTKVTNPEGDFVRYQYDPATGNREWEQDGRGDSTRVTFGYNAFRQVTSITRPGLAPESIAYDPVTYNLTSVTTPKGYQTLYRKDDAGRDTLIISQIDTMGSSILKGTQRILYDVSDRDTLVIMAGPAMSGHQAESVFVRKRFNISGQVDSLSRWGVPNKAGVGTITNRWRYDLAGRVTAQIAPDGRRDSTVYDPAGNIVALVTGRNHTISMSYDALHRLINRTLPSVSYTSRPSAALIDSDNYPHLKAPFVAYQIPGESQTYAYDARGRMLAAENSNARIKRNYYPNGQLLTDSTWIANESRSTFSLHSYGILHIYDLNGRPKMLSIPQQLRTPGQQSTITYSYENAAGLPTGVTDLQANAYALRYNARGEPKSLLYPQQYEQLYGYDPDGRLAGDTIMNRGSIVYPRITLGAIRANRLSYDARSRLLRRADVNGHRDTLSLAYSGLSRLVSSSMTERGWRPGETDRYSLRELFTYDPLGHRTRTERREVSEGFGTETRNDFRLEEHQNGTGRLTLDWASTWQAPLSSSDTATRYLYDPAGNIEHTALTRSLSTNHERSFFYAADGTLRATERRQYDPFWNGTRVTVVWKTSLEEYRYDPLGRRIWVKAQNACSLYDDPPRSEEVECKTSLVRRTIWDEDRELAEIQMPLEQAENDTEPVQLPLIPVLTGTGFGDPNPLFGRVVYTNVGSVDRPLAITRINYVYRQDEKYLTEFTPRVIGAATLMPFWNQQDVIIGAFTIRGETKICSPPTSDVECVGVPWTLYWSAYERKKGIPWSNWWGTLLERKLDKSGLEYKRNRYYDPANGRFSQEDPIGVSGGLNLYGFAEGDPVNFADPFGLCSGGWDIIYNMCGQPISFTINGLDHNRHYLNLGGTNYRLDDKLTASGDVGPYDINGDPRALDEVAKAISSIPSQKYDSYYELYQNSKEDGLPLDFKQYLPKRSLWNAGGGMYVHSDKVSNTAWGYYGARGGFSRTLLIIGGHAQGIGAGRRDPLDQVFVGRGYDLWKPK
jgi:RHS repeat-associated protein